jgi:hypothetical protein
MRNLLEKQLDGEHRISNRRRIFPAPGIADTAVHRRGP